jgi:osmotically-inducible protein OsmY
MEAMRALTIGMVLGVSGLLAATGCASVQKVEGEVQTEMKKNPNALKGAEDGALLVAAKAELAKNDKTKSHGFDVAVKGGVVTLKGTGPADAKAEAEKAVKVPGVSKVDNQIVVK